MISLEHCTQCTLVPRIILHGTKVGIFKGSCYPLMSTRALSSVSVDLGQSCKATVLFSVQKLVLLE